MARRPARTWIVIVGVLLMLMQTVGVVLWWKLPVWAPVWVVAHSPWLGPVLRAFEHTDGAYTSDAVEHLHRRLPTWGTRIGPVLRDNIEQGGPIEANDVVMLAIWLANEGEWSSFDPAAVAASGMTLAVLRDGVRDDLVAVAIAGIGEPDADTRVVTFLLAQSLRDPRLVPALCGAVDRYIGTQDIEERQAFETLRMIGDRGAVPAILRYVSRTGQSFDDGVLEACLPRNATEEPLAALAGKDLRLRAWACDWLAAGAAERLPTGPAIPEVTTAILTACTDAVLEVRLAAIDAAGALRLVAAVTPLSRMLRDPQPLTRLSVVRALGVIGDPAVVPALLPLLDDEDPDVQRATTDAVARLGDVRVVEGLLRLARNPDPDVAIAAIEALEKLPLSDDQRQRAEAADTALLPPGFHRRPFGAPQGGWQTVTPERRP